MGTRYSSPAFPGVGHSGLSKMEWVTTQIYAALVAEHVNPWADEWYGMTAEHIKARIRKQAQLAYLADSLARDLCNCMGSDAIDGDGSPPWHVQQSTNGRHTPSADDTVSFDPPPSGADKDDESGVDLGNCGAEDKP